MSRVGLYVFIDAFGWELMQRHPFLDDELELKAPLETVFGYSSTCDPTILTGLMPAEHGHFSFFVYNPERSPFGPCRWLRFLPRAITRRGRVRRLVSRAVKWSYGYTGYFQLYNMPFDRLHLFDYTEKRDIYEPGGINSGAPNIFDRLREAEVPFYKSDWRQGEETNLAAAAEALRSGQPAMIYLYLAAMDAQLHALGTEHPDIGVKIAWYEAQLRELLAVARAHYDEVGLHIFSDHGMTDIHAICDLQSRVASSGLRWGEDYVAVFDSTMARFWFLADGAQQRMREALAAEPLGHVLDDAQLEAWGCLFEPRTYGELFFLLDPGVLLLPSFMGESPLAGMHGYAPDDRHSTASYASNERRGEVPQRLADLFALMAREIPS